jgi:hypothetical protein
MSIANTKGRILVSKLDLMGYTPETQVYFIQNGGGSNGGSNNVFHFLQGHRKYFDHSLMMGRTYNSLPANRIEKFRAYAERNGFEVVEGEAI